MVWGGNLSRWHPERWPRPFLNVKPMYAVAGSFVTCLISDSSLPRMLAKAVRRETAGKATQSSRRIRDEYWLRPLFTPSYWSEAPISACHCRVMKCVFWGARKRPNRCDNKTGRNARGMAERKDGGGSWVGGRPFYVTVVNTWIWKQKQKAKNYSI